MLPGPQAPGAACLSDPCSLPVAPLGAPASPDPRAWNARARPHASPLPLLRVQPPASEPRSGHVTCSPPLPPPPRSRARPGLALCCRDPALAQHLPRAPHTSHLPQMNERSRSACQARHGEMTKLPRGHRRSRSHRAGEAAGRQGGRGALGATAVGAALGRGEGRSGWGLAG